MIPPANAMKVVKAKVDPSGSGGPSFCHMNTRLLCVLGAPCPSLPNLCHLQFPLQESTRQAQDPGAALSTHTPSQGRIVSDDISRREQRGLWQSLPPKAMCLWSPSHDASRHHYGMHGRKYHQIRAELPSGRLRLEDVSTQSSIKIQHVFRAAGKRALRLTKIAG